jgi:hypothetical protein
MQMNWNPFKAITLLESRIKKLEDLFWELDSLLEKKDKAEKSLAALRKTRQSEYGRRYYEKRKAEKAAKEQA